MVIIPNSRIILLKTPFEMSDNNQLTFSNASTQYNYFNSLPKLELDDASYQRKEGVIRFPTGENGYTFEDLLEYNYCMYQNEKYSDKWFYAYIEDITYSNDSMSYIQITTDVFQTWQFDITYRRSFVEREHVNDDTVGLHTIPESLETGEYVEVTKNESNTQISKLNYISTCYPVCAVTHSPISASLIVPGYNGIYSGLLYVALDGATSLTGFIKHTEKTTDCEIYSIFMVPNAMIGEITWGNYSDPDEGINYRYGYVVPIQSYFDLGDVTINRPLTLDSSYTPINKKLLTYPYQYFTMYNNAGNQAIYRYEEFTSASCNFNVRGAVGVGCDIRIQPTNYKNGNRLHMLSGFKLPTCGWISDAYTNWLTQNAVNLKLEQIGGVANTIIGAGQMYASGGSMGADRVGEGLGDIFGQLKERYNHYIAPDEAKGGINEGNLNFAEKIGFTYYKMSIKREYAVIIDNYFQMFGYKVNDVKIPNITGRQNWNYVKTINCNIIGDIPQKDMTKLRNMFDAGITLWHNPNTFLDYSQSNNIV